MRTNIDIDDGLMAATMEAPKALEVLEVLEVLEALGGLTTWPQ